VKTFHCDHCLHLLFFEHMIDTVETAGACGVQVRPLSAGDPAVGQVPVSVCDDPESFDALMASWFPLISMLNNLNRGLGQADAYPFVISGPVVEKLRCVHDTVAVATRQNRMGTRFAYHPGGARTTGARGADYTNFVLRQTNEKCVS
jgi:hypothetical protein